MRRTPPDWHPRPGSTGTLDGFSASGLAPSTSGIGLKKILILEICIIIGGPMLRDHKCVRSRPWERGCIA